MDNVKEPIQLEIVRKIKSEISYLKEKNTNIIFTINKAEYNDLVYYSLDETKSRNLEWINFLDVKLLIFKQENSYLLIEENFYNDYYSLTSEEKLTMFFDNMIKYIFSKDFHTFIIEPKEFVSFLKYYESKNLKPLQWMPFDRNGLEIDIMCNPSLRIRLNSYCSIQDLYDMILISNGGTPETQLERLNRMSKGYEQQRQKN